VFGDGEQVGRDRAGIDELADAPCYCSAQRQATISTLERYESRAPSVTAIASISTSWSG
jgi:hypothetical protein